MNLNRDSATFERAMQAINVALMNKHKNLDETTSGNSTLPKIRIPKAFMGQDISFGPDAKRHTNEHGEAVRIVKRKAPESNEMLEYVIGASTGGKAIPKEIRDKSDGKSRKPVGEQHEKAVGTHEKLEKNRKRLGSTAYDNLHELYLL